MIFTKQEDAMTTMRRTAVAVGLLMGLGAVPMVAWAAEHGGTSVESGKEHGGSAAAASKEHGGAAPAVDEASLLREAASALRKGEVRSDLAEKLEQLADKE